MSDRSNFSVIGGVGGVTPTSAFLYWDSSNNRYVPYSSKQSSLIHFYCGTTNPDNTTRINLDGSLYVPTLSITNIPAKTNETNILYYNTSSHALSSGNLTNGGNGSLQYNDNGVLNGTNLYWREDVSGFTWGTGYTPSGDTIFTLYKNFNYDEGATGFLSLGVCGSSSMYVLNIGYDCNYIYGCSYQIQSNLPLSISSCDDYTSGSSSILIDSDRTEINGFNCVVAKGNDIYFNAIKNTLYYEKTGITVNQLNLLRNCNRKIIQWGTTNGTNSTRLCNGLSEEYNNSLGNYQVEYVCHVAMSFDACVNGIDGINGDSVSFFFQGLIKRPSGGTVSIIGTPSKVFYKDTALSSADANVYANNTTKTLDICVCGVSGKCMLWNAIVNSMQLVGVKC